MDPGAGRRCSRGTSAPVLARAVLLAAVAYFVHLVDQDHRPVLISYGRYLDVLIRCDDSRWRILERVSEVHASDGSAAISFAA